VKDLCGQPEQELRTRPGQHQQRIHQRIRLGQRAVQIDAERDLLSIGEGSVEAGMGQRLTYRRRLTSMA